MNNNIYITLASPSVSAPDTGAFSSVHNGTTGTNGSNSILILSGLAILILIVAMAILLLVKKCNKDRKSNGRNHKGPFIRLLSRKATLFTCLMLLFSLAFATAFVVHKSADKTANATPADPSESNALTITVDDVRETIETNSSGVYTVMPSTITVGPNRYGYTLDMYATNGDLVHTNGTEIISGLSQNNGSATTLSTNTWGVALIQPTDKTSAVWRGIPTDQANALRLKDTTDENDNSTTIYYGVVADNSLPDGTYTDSINYVIVAKPAPTYTVVYDANGGTGSMDNQVIGKDSAIDLTANNLSRAGYTFTGWNTAADGSGTSYTNEQLVTNLASAGETVSLYAQWKATYQMTC